MTFLVTFIALLIERFFDWSHFRQWNWYRAYQRMIMHRLPAKSAYLVLGASIVSILVIVALISWVLQGLLYGLVTFIFSIFIVLYCLGPKNLWADIFASLNAFTHGDQKAANDALKVTFGMTEQKNAAFQLRLLDEIFIQANRRIFAVIFWYVLLGPIGAVLYRLAALSAFELNPQEDEIVLNQSAHRLEAILSWLPVRAFTFIFALAGHFVNVITYWRKRVLQGPASNDQLLIECGMAAIGDEELSGMKQTSTIEKSAVQLLDRAFVVVLVLIAMMVLML